MPVLRIQALALIPVFLGQVWQLGLIAGRAQRAMAVANGLALVLVIVLGVAFVPGGGATGRGVGGRRRRGGARHCSYVWRSAACGPGAAPTLGFAWKPILALALAAGVGYLLRDWPLAACAPPSWCLPGGRSGDARSPRRRVPRLRPESPTGSKRVSARPRVVVLRGHHANVGELRPWELLLDRYDVEVVTTTRADQGLDGLRVPTRVAPTRRARLPRGRLGTLATHAVGDAYTDVEALVRDAAIVHTAELGPWFAAQPARLRRRLGFRLVVTVWETIPFVSTFRTSRAAANRRVVLAEADLFLPTTHRARRCLLLEGVEPDRIEVVEPGIDVDRFRARPAGRDDGPSDRLPGAARVGEGALRRHPGDRRADRAGT